MLLLESQVSFVRYREMEKCLRIPPLKTITAMRATPVATPPAAVKQNLTVANDKSKLANPLVTHRPSLPSSTPEIHHFHVQTWSTVYQPGVCGPAVRVNNRPCRWRKILFDSLVRSPVIESPSRTKQRTEHSEGCLNIFRRPDD